MIDLDQAATSRRTSTRAAADRPSQRRSGEHPDAPVRALTAAAPTIREKSDELIFAKVDPALDPLRNEPRFRAILKELRFL